MLPWRAIPGCLCALLRCRTASPSPSPLLGPLLGTPPPLRYWKIRFTTNYWEDDDWAGLGQVIFHGRSSGGIGQGSSPLCEELESSTFEEKLRLVQYFLAQGEAQWTGLATSISLLASQAEAMKRAGVNAFKNPGCLKCLEAIKVRASFLIAIYGHITLDSTPSSPSHAASVKPSLTRNSLSLPTC